MPEREPPDLSRYPSAWIPIDSEGKPLVLQRPWRWIPTGGGALPAPAGLAAAHDSPPALVWVEGDDLCCIGRTRVPIGVVEAVLSHHHATGSTRLRSAPPENPEDGPDPEPFV
jgi:hypothetical protein